MLEHQESPAGARPSGSPVYYVVYAFCVTASVLLFAVGGQWFIKKLDAYQLSRPQYALQRADQALKEGNKVQAQTEVAQLLREMPRYQSKFFGIEREAIWEGPVMRDLVTPLEQLSADLMQAGLYEEAESTLWKALLEYHLNSRYVELPVTWELLYHAKMLNDDWVSAFEVAHLLAAHGVSQIRRPDQIQPMQFNVDRSLFSSVEGMVPGTLVRGMAAYAQAEKPEEFKRAADLLHKAWEQAGNPVIKRRAAAVLHRSLVQSSQRAEARRFFVQVYGRQPAVMDLFWRNWPERVSTMNLLDRDPTLLEMFWRDRPSNARLSIQQFLLSFYGDSRLSVTDFLKLERKPNDYFSPGHHFIREGGEVVLFQNISTQLEVQTANPVHQVVLAYQATKVLGVYPLLLLKINNDPYIPIYCDSDQPELATVECDLLPGNHRFELVYLNDGGYEWPAKKIEEDRNLRLIRLGLVHVSPSGL